MIAGDPIGVHVAVVAGRGQGKEFALARAVFFGTAFVIAPDLVATAAHVYRNAASCGEVALWRHRMTPGGVESHGFPVSDADVFDDIDLALLSCPRIDAPVLSFEFEALPLFEEVQAVGFPFSLDPERLIFVVRGFAGHVVARREHFRLKGQPPCYELSFIAPRGLSGAPLLARRNDRVLVAGVVIEEDGIEIDGIVTKLGIALDAQEFLRVTSRLVDGTLAERVFHREPLPPKTLRPVRSG